MRAMQRRNRCRTLIGVLALAHFGLAWAAPALPARRMRVELRCVSMPPPGPSAAGLPPGSVVVGTLGVVDRSGSVVVRTAPPPRDALPVLQVMVMNGSRARARWQAEALLPQVDFVWTGQAPGVAITPAQPKAPAPTRALASGRSTTPAPAALLASAAGVGIIGRTERQLSEALLEVTPRWAGGSTPVQVQLTALYPLAPDNAGRTRSLSAATTLALPFDRWVPVARSADPPPAPGGVVAPPNGGYRLELRVTLLPD